MSINDILRLSFAKMRILFFFKNMLRSETANVITLIFQLHFIEVVCSYLNSPKSDYDRTAGLFILFSFFCFLFWQVKKKTSKYFQAELIWIRLTALPQVVIEINHIIGFDLLSSNIYHVAIPTTTILYFWSSSGFFFWILRSSIMPD